MKRKVLLLCLVSITLLAAVLRVYRFPSLPLGLNQDESALGYNAYSILKTGQDEWGKSWPLTFRSFGDYKLGGYIYALVPFVQVFGLSAVAVRLPSLLAGILLPLAVYFLVVTLTKNAKIGVLSAFMLALSPWAIFFSRVGFEANLALVIFIAGLAFFFRSFTSRKNLLVCVLCLIVSFLTYNTPLLLMPFITAVSLAVYKKGAVRSTAAVVVAAVIAAALILPAIKGKGTITVFSDPGVLKESQELYQRSGGNIFLRILSKPFIFTTTRIGTNYLSTFSPIFLVTKGGSNPWHQSNGSGHLTWGVYVLALLGILLSVFRRKKTDLVMLALLLMSPIPSAITVDAPHATRSLLFFVMLGVFAAYGLYEIWTRKKLVGIFLLAVVLVEALVRFNHNIIGLTVAPQTQWNVGMDKAIIEAERVHAETGRPIVMLGDVHYFYIYPLFVNKIDPQEFRGTVQYYPPDAIGLSQVKSFGRYAFVDDSRDIDYPAVMLKQNRDEGTFTVSQN